MLHGYIGLMTHPRVVERPLTAKEAIADVVEWLNAPNAPNGADRSHFGVQTGLTTVRDRAGAVPPKDCCATMIVDDYGYTEVKAGAPATGYKDQTDKLALYETAGVTEYWIVNGEARYVMVYRREENGFAKPDYYRFGESVESFVLSTEETAPALIALSDFL